MAGGGKYEATVMEQFPALNHDPYALPCVDA